MIATTEQPATNSSDRERQPVDSTSVELAESLKVFSDPTRLQLLKMLTRNGEMNVNAMCHELGQSQPAVSHHLALLRDAEVVVRRREGKFNFYRPSRSAVASSLTINLKPVAESVSMLTPFDSGDVRSTDTRLARRKFGFVVATLARAWFVRIFPPSGDGSYSFASTESRLGLIVSFGTDTAFGTQQELPDL